MRDLELIALRAGCQALRQQRDAGQILAETVVQIALEIATLPRIAIHDCAFDFPLFSRILADARSGGRNAVGVAQRKAVPANIAPLAGAGENLFLEAPTAERVLRTVIGKWHQPTRERSREDLAPRLPR